MATRQDVVAEIERQFTGSDRTTALKTLNLFTDAPGERERVQLEILGQSGGSLDKLRALVDTAKRNPRAARPAAPSRGSQEAGVTDMTDPRLAQATAIAQLQGAHHVKGQDPELAIGRSKEYPPYRYIFYVAIGIIPVLTLGGAIPLAIAGAGIGGCRQFATDARQPHINRILFCVGITIACWVALFALVGGVALLRSRS